MDLNLKLFHPIKTEKEIFFSKLINDDSEFFMQFNKNNLVLNKENFKAKLTITDSEVSQIKDISDEVIKLTSLNSETWFGKFISVEDCFSIYKNAIVDNVLHCFFDDSTMFFSSKDQFSIEDVESELNGIALLNCVGVVYTKTSFFLRWEISQFKIKSDKSNVQEKYLIKDLDEHSRSLKDENLIKKIEDITLF